MRRALLGLSAIMLVAGLATACTDSGAPRTSDRPGDRTPSASPPTTSSPYPATTPPSPSSPTDSTTPGSTGSSSSGTR